MGVFLIINLSRSTFTEMNRNRIYLLLNPNQKEKKTKMLLDKSLNLAQFNDNISSKTSPIVIGQYPMISNI